MARAGLEVACQLGVRRGEDRGGGPSLADLVRESRPGEDRHAARSAPAAARRPVSPTCAPGGPLRCPWRPRGRARRVRGEAPSPWPRSGTRGRAPRPRPSRRPPRPPARSLSRRDRLRQRHARQEPGILGGRRGGSRAARARTPRTGGRVPRGWPGRRGPCPRRRRRRPPVGRRHRAPLDVGGAAAPEAGARSPKRASVPARRRWMFAWCRAVTMTATASPARASAAGIRGPGSPAGARSRRRWTRARRTGTRRRGIANTTAAGISAHGVMRRNAPRAVATPLPPRNRRNTGQQLPTTARKAAAPAQPGSGARLAPDPGGGVALGDITEERGHGWRPARGAEHVGRADVAAAPLADVDAQDARDHVTDRDGADQIGAEKPERAQRQRSSPRIRESTSDAR